MALSGFSLGQFYIRIQDQELRENALELLRAIVHLQKNHIALSVK